MTNLAYRSLICCSQLAGKLKAGGLKWPHSHGRQLAGWQLGTRDWPMCLSLSSRLDPACSQDSQKGKQVDMHKVRTVMPSLPHQSK